MSIGVSYTYTYHKCIFVRVMETFCIFFYESNYGIVDLCHLWDETHQLDILNHPKVGFARLLGGPGRYVAPYNHPYVSQGWPRTLIISPGKLLLRLVYPFLIDKPSQLSLPDYSFYLLFQVVAVRCIMTMIVVEAAILVPRPLARVSL